MNCIPNRRGSLWRAVVMGIAVLGLAACAKKAPAVLPPPPASPPSASAPPPPPKFYLLSGSPSVLARFPSGTEITLKTRICLKAEEQVTVVGPAIGKVFFNTPGCLRRDPPLSSGTSLGGFRFSLEDRSLFPLELFGGDPTPVVVYRVASGSPSALARFPRSTLVSLQTEICLKAGEQITVIGSNGQSVTYNRPGCLKRDGRPTGENAGGFTFGWAFPKGAAVREAAK